MAKINQQTTYSPAANTYSTTEFYSDGTVVEREATKEEIYNYQLLCLGKEKQPTPEPTYDLFYRRAQERKYHVKNEDDFS